MCANPVPQMDGLNRMRAGCLILNKPMMTRIFSVADDHFNADCRYLILIHSCKQHERGNFQAGQQAQACNCPEPGNIKDY